MRLTRGAQVPTPSARVAIAFSFAARYATLVLRAAGLLVLARILGQALLDAVPAIAASGAVTAPAPQANHAPAGQSQTSGQFKPAAA